MKLLKVGSSPSCDIVISDPYVSSLHAEITVLDNGEIVIEDKNSSNGTFVGNKKIAPNSEVTVRRGDHVMLAKTPLPWTRVPTLPSGRQYKQIVNIGSSFRNDIIVGNAAVSRFHAIMKIDKSGKTFICDNGSTNGTQVNGIKIQPNKDVRIKRGDNVMCGGEDISEQLLSFMPKSIVKSVLGVVASVVALAAVAVLGYVLWPSTKIEPAEYQNSVVYIHSAYHYEISVGNFTFRYPTSEEEYEYSSATGFFLDREGRIGTARHVAVPWDEAYSKETREVLKTIIQNYIHSQIRVSSVVTTSDLAILRSTSLGNKLYNDCESLPDLNRTITNLLSGDVTIDGKMDFFAVGYNGRNYENLSEFHRCTLIAESKDAKKDVAILQLNDKKTPEFVKHVFDVSKVTETPLKPMEDALYTIGYPHGLLWNYSVDEKQIKSSIRETKCSKTPDRYGFEFQANTQGGASGSPIFTQKDARLVGVLSAAYISEAGPTVAAHAIFLKKLYEESITPIAR